VCGPVTATLRCEGPPDSTAATLYCERCESAVGELPRPGFRSASCRKCGGEDAAWLDDEGRFWSPALEPLSGKLGRWVRADVDGHYAGRDPRNPRALLIAPHRFELAITAAQWTGMRFVDGPPSRRREDESQEPWRQDFVRGVFVLNDAEGNQEHFEGALEDFRLHDWAFSSVEQSGSGGARVTGRLRGTAYGRLVRPVKADAQPDPKIVEPDKPADSDVPDPEPPTGETPEPPAPEPPPELPKAPPPPDDLPLNHCARCSVPGIAVVSLLLWLVCSLGTAIAGAAALTLQCLLHQWILRAKLSFRGWRALLLGVLTVGVALGSFFMLAGGAGNARCGGPISGWTLFLALSYFATAWHPSCWPRRVTVILLILALFMTCRTDPLACGPGEQAPAEADPASRVTATFAETVGEWMSRLKFDEAADVIDDLPPVESMLTTGGPRVSIEQALSEPRRYFSCEAPDGAGDTEPAPFNVYFGEKTLFRLNDATLRPEAEFALRKIARLLRITPGARMILTGHTDSTGQEDFNLALSDARARAVADWLIRTQRIDPSRIEARGVADREPIIQALGPARLNRRVEMKIDCRKAGTDL